MHWKEPCQPQCMHTCVATQWSGKRIWSVLLQIPFASLNRPRATTTAFKYENGHWHEARLIVTASSLEHVDPRTGKLLALPSSLGSCWQASVACRRANEDCCPASSLLCFASLVHVYGDARCYGLPMCSLLMWQQEAVSSAGSILHMAESQASIQSAGDQDTWLCAYTSRCQQHLHRGPVGLDVCAIPLVISNPQCCRRRRVAH